MAFECKYVGLSERAPGLARWLEACFPPDGQHPVNQVHSVYFDTDGLDGLAESRDGDLHKCKYRLRYYDDDPRRAWLECKARHGRTRDKWRREVVGPAALNGPRLGSLTCSSWLPLCRELEEMSKVPLHSPLVPVVHLRYRRSRFVAPSGLRLALDDCIYVETMHPRFGVAALPLSPLPWAVFETKGDTAEFSEIHHVRALGFRRSSFSKYAHAMARAEAVGA